MFEAVLMGRPPSRTRSLAAPAAIALHVAALGTILAVSAWKISDIAEPALPILFVNQAVPPPLGDPGRHDPPTGHAAQPHHPSNPVPAALPALAPSTIPDAIPTILPSSPTDLLGSSTAGDDLPGAGDPDGVPGGVAQSSIAPVGGSAPIPVGTPNVVPPRLVSQPAPNYPESARRIRLDGLVVVEAVIGLDGSVENARVMSATSPLFEDAALSAVRRWRYTAATMNGRAVRVYLSATLKFTLH